METWIVNVYCSNDYHDLDLWDISLRDYHKFRYRISSDGNMSPRGCRERTV